MKRNSLIKFLIILIIVVLPLYFFSEELSEWHFNKKIKITGSSNKYKYFFLDKEVYQYANRDLSDLRILDDSNNIVPFYIKEEFQEEKEEVLKYKSKQIYQFKNKKENFSIYDFQVLSDKSDLDINILFLETNMDNYSKQIEVYGRRDNTNWKLLTKDTIYTIEDLVRNKINLGGISKNNFYRIKVLDNIENLVIRKCSLFYSKIIKGSQQYIKNVKLKFEVENNNNEKYSIVNIKNIYNLKLIKLNLEINGNFKRAYYLYDGTSDNVLQRDYIYNFKSNNINITNTEIDLDYNYLTKNENLLTIINNDNQPLEINNIKGSYLIDKIIFEDIGSKSYLLYFGNIKASKPKYDIDSYKNYIDKEDQAQCDLGGINRIKPLINEKKGFNYKLLFNIIIIIASISLVIILVLKLTKK